MDYLVKNGAPRCVQDIKDDLFKIRSFHNFSYNEGGQDHGQGGKFLFSLSPFIQIVLLVRDKSRELCELLENPQQLQNEREFARQTREKMGTLQNTSSQQPSGSFSNY